MVRLQAIYARLAGEQTIAPEAKQTIIEVISKPESGFLALFDKIIEVKELDYIITKKIEINQDTVFPVGTYHIKPECGIIAKDCKITIQPGTNFYFDDLSFLHFEGKLNAIGTKQDRIQFLAEDSAISSLITFHNLEAKLEHCKLADFHASSTTQKYSVHAMNISKSKVNLKYFEVSGNQAHQIGTVHASESKLTLENCLFEKNLVYMGSLFLNETDAEIYDTVFRNNYPVLEAEHAIGVAIMALKEEKIYAENCEFSCHLGGVAITLAMTVGSVFKKTAFRNNFGGAIFSNSGKIELDNECIVEGCGDLSPFSEGVRGLTFKYNPSIIKKQEKPGRNNLPMVKKEITQDIYYKMQETDIPRLIKKAKEKYGLGESESHALEYSLKRTIKHRKPIDYGLDKKDDFNFNNFFDKKKF